MKKIWYRVWLSFLRSAVHLKRLVVWGYGSLAHIRFRLGMVFRDTIGFRIYKIHFFYKKNPRRWHLPDRGHWGDFFGRRGTLQVLFLGIALAIMIPHSRFTTLDAQATPGRKTILYALAGPGDEVDENLEEIDAEDIRVLQPLEPSWREGAVSGIGPYTGFDQSIEAKDPTAITMDGTAVTKPTIMPGATIDTTKPSVPEPSSTRTEIVEYVVQPGDVIGSIAEHYGVSIATILWANDLTLRSLIRPGDTLKILPVSGVMYTVKRGDTVGKIAKLYGADIDEIITANTLSADGRGLSIGGEIIIPNGVKLAPVYVPRPVVAAVNGRAPLRSIVPPPSSAASAGSGFLWPAAVRTITQYFGLRHNGLDIAGDIGTAIFATKSGTVITSQCGYNFGYGCFIIIDHGDGLTTLYGHMSHRIAEVGEQVERGQTIGLIGTTGNSTGPHVHFEVRVGGVRKNPLRYVR